MADSVSENSSCWVNLQLLQKISRRVARNSQWGVGCFGDLGAELPGAEDHWGSKCKIPSLRRHGGVGAKPPALKNFFAFFRKNNLIVGLFFEK